MPKTKIVNQQSFRKPTVRCGLFYALLYRYIHPDQTMIGTGLTIFHQAIQRACLSRPENPALLHRQPVLRGQNIIRPSAPLCRVPSTKCLATMSAATFTLRHYGTIDTGMVQQLLNHTCTVFIPHVGGIKISHQHKPGVRRQTALIAVIVVKV